jgi:hypothetical protein
MRGMWKSLLCALASFVIIREIIQQIRKRDAYMKALDEFQTRWKSYVDLRHALEEGAQIYALQPNSEQLQEAREQDVAQDFDKLKQNYDHLAKQLAAVENGEFKAEKAIAEYMFDIEPEMTEKYLSLWLTEQRIRLELTQRKWTT